MTAPDHTRPLSGYDPYAVTAAAAEFLTATADLLDTDNADPGANWVYGDAVLPDILARHNLPRVAAPVVTAYAWYLLGAQAVHAYHQDPATDLSTPVTLTDPRQAGPSARFLRATAAKLRATAAKLRTTLPAADTGARP